MPYILEDRVLESTTTTGIGDITLAGAITGFRRFNAVCAIGDTVPYFIEALDASGQPSGDYEYGVGTYTAANTLTRTTVRGSSNAGAAVNFTAGSKNVGLSPGGIDWNGKAPVASPTFTGTPAAPNAALGTRGTRLATMESFNTEFANLMAGNGYLKLPGGLIIQWGSGPVANGAGSTFALPTTFPNGGYSVVAMHNGGDSSVNIVGVFNSSSQLTLQHNYPGSSVQISWIAFGH